MSLLLSPQVDRTNNAMMPRVGRFFKCCDENDECEFDEQELRFKCGATTTTTTTTPPCCDPLDEPGACGNAFCIEGARCCADGQWACNEGDGSSTCPNGEEADACRMSHPPSSFPKLRRATGFSACSRG